jgi:hypothetical protein
MAAVMNWNGIGGFGLLILCWILIWMILACT